MKKLLICTNLVIISICVSAQDTLVHKKYQQLLIDNILSCGCDYNCALTITRWNELKYSGKLKDTDLEYLLSQYLEILTVLNKDKKHNKNAGTGANSEQK